MVNAYFCIQTERCMIGCDTIKIIYGIKFVFYRPSSFPVSSKTKKKEERKKKTIQKMTDKKKTYTTENATIQTVIMISWNQFTLLRMQCKVSNSFQFCISFEIFQNTLNGIVFLFIRIQFPVVKHE